MSCSFDKVLIIIFLIVFTSCGNDLTVNMDNEGLPVAYCILDLDDSIQQVRLAKSFFPGKDYRLADHMTLDQWDEPVEIYIEEWANPDQPVIYDFHLADTIRQDTGFFENPSFKLYETCLKPLSNTLYYIYLWFPERSYYAFAATRTASHSEVLNPAAIPGRTVTFSDMDDFIVELRPGLNTEYHQFSFVLTVEEQVGTTFNLGYFNFGGQAYEENTGQILNSQLNSDRFYQNILSRYPPLTGNDYRRITGLEFVVFSYGSELRLYNQLYNNGSQPWEIQSYSSFRNGFGLFSSKAESRVINLELSDLTFQILAADPRYKQLKFIR
ncbi:MAG: hypothetical protein WC699_09410 [Bacteroidales bacterium]|jgi:hypothetical protein